MNLNLDYTGFEKYMVGTKELFYGIQYRFRFENGFGASVVKHFGSYGHDCDLWELAVLKYEGDESHLTYTTEITDDVLGYLDDSKVREYLYKIKELEEV